MPTRATERRAAVARRTWRAWSRCWPTRSACTGSRRRRSTGDDRRPALPLAVWIDGSQDPKLSAPRRSLDRLTVAPAAVLSGSLQRGAERGPGRARDAAACRRHAGAARPASGWVRPRRSRPMRRSSPCDEDELGNSGERAGPHFRPGPSPDRWLACDDSGHACWSSRRAATAESVAAQLRPHPAGATSSRWPWRGLDRPAARARPAAALPSAPQRGGRRARLVGAVTRLRAHLGTGRSVRGSGQRSAGCADRSGGSRASRSSSASATSRS